MPEGTARYVEPDLEEVVFRAFIFQPTSFDSYLELYENEILYPDTRLYRLRLSE